jgi:TolB-like protein/Flp pilus assembly protein TadD
MIHRFAGYTIDRGAFEIRHGDERIPTEPRVLELLLYLIDRHDRIVTKDELLEAIWQGRCVSESALSSCVKAARKLVGDDGAAQRCIRTIPRRGFRFVAEVVSSASTPAVRDLAPQRGHEASVAVLAFADMSPDKSQTHFCDGMAEEIINALTRIEGLRVAARTSSFAFRETHADVREIGARLGVAAVVEGSVRCADDRLRVVAQLIDTSSGFHRWSERWDRPLSDVFTVQDEIALRVAEAMKLHLTSADRASIASRRAQEMSAYDLYLRGLAYRRQFGHRSLRFAMGMFDRALAIDPGYAPAWAGLSTCHALLYTYAHATDEHLRAATDAGARALQEDPRSAEAHVAVGTAAALRGDFGSAEAAYTRAHELDPRLFDAWYSHGRCCAARGLNDRAVQLYETAARVRPEDYEALLMATQVYDSLGRAEHAEDAARRSLAAAERALALNPDDVRALALCSILLARAGRVQEAHDWVERAVTLERDEPYVHYNVACTLIRLGERGRALDHLERIDVGAMANRAWMEHDSSLDPVRGEPRFKALLAKSR